MNEQVKACGHRASECEHRALAATEGETRHLYWQMASLWRDIARLTANHEDERDRLEAQMPHVAPQ
jgi:hypothetical protein